MSNTSPSFYAIIPAHIRYCKDLEPNAKLLYGEITALCSIEGYCWATNQYFADLYEVDTFTIQRWLKSMKEKKFIKVEIFKTGIQTQRKIWIVDGFQINLTKPQNCGADTTKLLPPHHENVVHINTSSNTSSNTYKKNTPPSVLTTPTKEKTKEIRKENIQKKDACSAPASALCDFLLKEIKAKKPDFSKGITTSWYKDAERLLKVRTPEQIALVIKWASEHKFWCDKIFSPHALFQNLDMMEFQMKQATSAIDKVVDHKAYVEAFIKKYGDLAEMEVYPDGVNFKLGQTGSLYIKFADVSFRAQVENRLRKMGVL